LADLGGAEAAHPLLAGSSWCQSLHSDWHHKEGRV